jgi:phosphoserine phosphatase
MFGGTLVGRKHIPVALAYDFDGTLAPGNMQERNFIPDLGLKPKYFWRDVKAAAKKHDMDEILAYLELMLDRASFKDMPISRQAFEDYGRQLTFFPGVEGWFDRINRFGKSIGVAVSHYVISSGLREMIAGTSIAKHLTYIFASGFRYDVHDVAKWPALAVNYTNKAQYLFRINKGIENSYDNSTINKFMPADERPVPFSNIIYIGDGETDIPAMKMVTHQGGRAIAVYPPRKKGAREAAHKLVEQGRANGAALASYVKGSALEKAVYAGIRQIAAQHEFFASTQVPTKGSSALHS